MRVSGVCRLSQCHQPHRLAHQEYLLVLEQDVQVVGACKIQGLLSGLRTGFEIGVADKQCDSIAHRQPPIRCAAFLLTLMYLCESICRKDSWEAPAESFSGIDRPLSFSWMQNCFMGSYVCCCVLRQHSFSLDVSRLVSKLTFVKTLIITVCVVENPCQATACLRILSNIQ